MGSQTQDMRDFGGDSKTQPLSLMLEGMASRREIARLKRKRCSADQQTRRLGHVQGDRARGRKFTSRKKRTEGGESSWDAMVGNGRKHPELRRTESAGKKKSTWIQRQTHGVSLLQEFGNGFKQATLRQMYRKT